MSLRSLVLWSYTEREFIEHALSFKLLLGKDPQQPRVGHSLSVISLLDAFFSYSMTIGINRTVTQVSSMHFSASYHLDIKFKMVLRKINA